jgi:5-methylcytosine-specific restriction endonuclease McrA
MSCGNRPVLHCPDHAEVKAQRDAARANQRTHTVPTHKRGYDAQWRKVRALVLANDRRCFWCGGHATTVDHVLPIGTHPELRLDLDNLVPACRHCNSARTTRRREERA